MKPPPKTPYVEWAIRQSEDLDLAKDSVSDHLSVYLVPEDPDEQDETGPLEWFYEEVFEQELESWTTDESVRPADRTLEMFLEWFDVVGESLVVDLGTGDIEFEQL